MAPERRQYVVNIMNMRTQNSSTKKKPNSGKKPLPDPTTVSHVFLMIIMHICRKIILFEPEIKVTIYLGALVFVSLVTDFLPIPRSYFSQKSNLFNQIFVKWGWLWTLVVVGLYLGLTSYVYCCANIERIRKHFYRLGVGTVSWFVWTKLFVLIEAKTAACFSDKFVTKSSCVKHGYPWGGFDISGHAFLLIYCCLLMAEEAKSIRGWERIGELIRNEEYEEDSPLKVLSNMELKSLQVNYERCTPYIRAAFICMTVLFVIWDVMLVATILYFHHMVQKVIGGAIAILMWFVTYRWWYAAASPGLPGNGSFKYSDVAVQRSRRSSVPREVQAS